MNAVRSILLFLCLLGPYLAIFLYLQQEKRELKREIKHSIIEGIDRTELVRLSFTPEELATKVRWEHSEEFEFDGEMYDVVETEKQGENTVFWCWWDHAETSLNKKLNQLLALALGHSNNDQDPSGPIGGFMKLLYDHVCATIELRHPETVTSHTVAYHPINSYFFPAPVAPPPQV